MVEKIHDEAEGFVAEANKPPPRIDMRRTSSLFKSGEATVRVFDFGDETWGASIEARGRLFHVERIRDIRRLIGPIRPGGVSAPEIAGYVLTIAEFHGFPTGAEMDDPKHGPHWRLGEVVTLPELPVGVAWKARPWPEGKG